MPVVCDVKLFNLAAIKFWELEPKINLGIFIFTIFWQY